MGLFKKQKTDFNKNIFEGASIQQALTNAAEALKVPPEQISYDVISYGSTGVFGLVGNKRAEIRVRSSMRVKEKALSATEKYWREIQEEQEKFANKELSREKYNSGKHQEENKPETAKPKNTRKAQNSNRNTHNEREKRTDKTVVESAPIHKTDTIEEQKEKNSRRNRSRNRKRTPKSFDIESTTTEHASSSVSEIEISTEPLTGQFAQAYDVLLSLSQALLDSPFQIVYALTEKKISYIIKGENLSALIGKNGNTRRSLQLVADRIINKGGQSKYDVNVVVDTVRQNKSKRLLTSLARKKADLCRKTQEEISLGFMNAYERCVIHIALKKDPDVETKSVGEGAKKEIFVVPTDKSKSAVKKAEEHAETQVFDDATEAEI